MRLDEITKEEFLDKLKDPKVAEVNKWAKLIDREIKARFPGNWTVEVVDPPEDFYADKYININFVSDYRPSSATSNKIFNIASDIIAIPSLHDVSFGHMNAYVSDDIQIDISFGRDDLYKNYSPDELEMHRMKR